MIARCWYTVFLTLSRRDCMDCRRSVWVDESAMYAADLRRQWEGERKKALNLQKQRQAAAKLRQERFVERRSKLRTERQAAQADARAKFDKRIRGKQASPDSHELCNLGACDACDGSQHVFILVARLCHACLTACHPMCRHWFLKREPSGGMHSKASMVITGSRGSSHC